MTADPIDPDGLRLIYELKAGEIIDSGVSGGPVFRIYTNPDAIRGHALVAALRHSADQIEGDL